MLDKAAIQSATRLNITLWEKIGLFICALFPLISLNYYFFADDAVLYKNSILNLFLYIPIVLLIFKSHAISDKSLFKKSALGAIIISIMLICGRSVYETNDMSLIFKSFLTFTHSILLFIGFYIFFYFTIKLGLYYMCHFNIKSPTLNERRYFGANWRSLILLWSIIFLCWLPCYLAYFPGIYSYDIVQQTFQALGIDSFNRFQTTAHTFLFKICIDFSSMYGGAKAALVTYSIAQMLLLSFAFSLTIWYMAKIKIHYVIRILSLIYFALNPLNAIFSFIPTKDVTFTVFFILTTLMLIDVVRDTEGFFHSRIRQSGLCLLLILCCLFRNNAVYALFLFFICFLFIYKKYYKKILCIFAAFLISFACIIGPIYTALGVEEGNIKEALSVPMQQIANVLVKHDEELNQSEYETIYEVMNYYAAKSFYNPRYADPVKDNFYTNVFVENPIKYIKLWFSLFIKYPGDYIDSFLSLNLGYWYPDCVYPDRYSNRAYIETYITDIEEFKIERESVFPELLEVYESFASGTSTQEIPIISLFFSIGFPIWFIFICALIFIAKHKRKLILVLLPAFFLWVSFMAGPVSNLRYIYHIIACYPIYMAVVFQSDLFSNNKEEKLQEIAEISNNQKETVQDDEIEL